MSKEQKLDKKIKNLEFVKGAIIKDLNLLKQTSYKKLYNSEVKRVLKIMKKLRNGHHTQIDNLNHQLTNQKEEKNEQKNNE